MARTSNVIRSLRSTNAVKNLEEKYDFDVDEFKIAPTKSLKIISRGLPKSAKTPLDDSLTTQGNEEVDALDGLEDTTRSITNMILEIEDHQLNQQNAKDREDSLLDDIFQGFHKKMLKQENRMLETELMQGENEAERLHLLYEKLDLATWLTTLRKITVITDLDDDNEISRKKEQTQKYIKSVLEKFEIMKTRCNVLARNYKTGKLDPSRDWPKLYKKIDRKLLINYRSSSDEDEEDMDVEDIKQHRRQKRRKQFRGSLIIQLTATPKAPLTKYAIVAEPLIPPYVIRVSKEERKRWNRSMESAPAKFEYYAQLPNQIAVAKRKFSMPLYLKADKIMAQGEPSMCLESQNDSHLRLPVKRISIKVNSRNLESLPKKLSPPSLLPTVHTPPMRRKRRRQE